MCCSRRVLQQACARGAAAAADVCGGVLTASLLSFYFYVNIVARRLERVQLSRSEEQRLTLSRNVLHLEGGQADGTALLSAPITHTHTLRTGSTTSYSHWRQPQTVTC